MPDTVTLRRFQINEHGAFGIMSYREKDICVTLENTWVENEKNLSCILPGSYQCTAHNGQKYTNVWQLMNVPNRIGILIHNGNTAKDTEGCILVGKWFADFDGVYGITDSKATLLKLRAALPKKFTISITGPEGFNY